MDRFSGSQVVSSVKLVWWEGGALVGLGKRSKVYHKEVDCVFQNESLNELVVCVCAPLSFRMKLGSS